MAFDPNKYIAQKSQVAKSTGRISDTVIDSVGEPSGFDPDAYLQKKATPPTQKQPSLLDRGQAALEGFGDMATFGYLPQLQAGAAKVVDKLAGFEDEPYVKTRDKFIRRGERLAEEMPGSYLAGQAAGAIVTPGMGMGKAATLGVKVARAGLIGAGTGLVMNPGDTEGEVSGLQLEERGKNALKSGAIGGAGQSAVGLAGKGLSKWAEKGKGLQKASNTMAVTAAGAKTGELNKLYNKKTIAEVGEFLKKEKLVGPGKTVNDTLEGADKILQDTGAKIRVIYERAKGQVLSPTQMADELNSVFEAELKGKAGGRQILARVQGELDNLRDMGDVADIERVLNFRRGLDDLINYDKAVRDMPGAQQALKKMRDHLKERIEKEISSMRPEDIGPLKELNKRYWGAAEAESIAKRAVAREESKMILGLPELIVGSAVGGAGAVNDVAQGQPEDVLASLAKGALAGVAFKGARKYGPGLGVVAADKGGKLLQMDPTRFPAKAGAGLLERAAPGIIGSGSARLQKKKNKKRKDERPSGAGLLSGVE
jgi:hypothetical protein